MPKAARNTTPLSAWFVPLLTAVGLGLVVLLILGAYSSFGTLFQLQKTERTAVIKPIIGVLLGSVRTERWQRDLDFMEQYAAEQDAILIIETANDDVDLQINQAEDLITEKVDALIVIPYNSEQTATIVEKAHQADIPVIAYDRMIISDQLDYYISFDSEKVGFFQADEVLKKVPQGKIAYVGGDPNDNNATLLKEGTMLALDEALNNGDIEIVSDTFTDGWLAENAYQTISDYLATGGELDGVIAANDGTARGVIQALDENGLAGTVPVSGQDAELSAIKRIVAGTQTMTVYKPLSQLAETAISAAVLLAQDGTVTTNATLSNGLIDVPAILLDSVIVTNKNIEQTIIEDGFHTKEAIYNTKK
jgi:D-xylose transport system substrate-binding protein